MSFFSTQLKELREQKNLSMAQLALKIGVSDAAICKWENALAEPKISYIYALADFFEVSTDYLLGLEDDIGKKKYSVPVKKDVEISPNGKELLDIFNKLEPMYQAQILEYARYTADRRGIKRKKA